jgi:hypothetical protein
MLSLSRKKKSLTAPFSDKRGGLSFSSSDRQGHSPTNRAVPDLRKALPEKIPKI